MLRDGRLAAGCIDGRIWLVDVDTGAIGGEPSLCHAGRVTALAVFPDGTLASGSDDQTVRVWDVSSGVCVAVLAGCQGAQFDSVLALAVLTNGNLASAGGCDIVKLWNAATWTCYAVLTPARTFQTVPGVQTMVALPDGPLACGDWDGVIRVWDTHTCLPSRDGDAAIRRRAAVCCVVGNVTLEKHAFGAPAMAMLPDIRVWSVPPLQSRPGPPSMASPLV